jgi:hypothetical protein
MSIQPAPGVTDLLAGERESYRRGFLVGMALAASAGDRAAVDWARSELAKDGHRHLDYLA